MNVVSKNGLWVVAFLVGGLVLYEVLKKKTSALSLPANRYTPPRTGGTVADLMRASTDSFATLYGLFTGGKSGQGYESPSWLNDPNIFQDTSSLPGGTSGGVAFGPPSPGVFGSDPGTGFDTGGSLSDASFDPSTMDVSEFSFA